MNRTRINRWILYLLIGIGWGNISFSPLSYSEEKETVWLYGKLQEVNSASPMVGEASFPLSLARAVLAAIPPKYLKNSKDAGFDIDTISQVVESMPKGEIFEMTQNDYKIAIHKGVVSATPVAKPYSLIIRNENIKLPVPLMITGMAVKVLQMAFKDFAGLDTQLTHVFEEVKNTPPGLLLKGEDKLMNEWLEIRLE